jgi:hypothetical protein
LKNPFQAHSAKKNQLYKSEFSFAERAFKDHNQPQLERFKGTFAA